MTIKRIKWSEEEIKVLKNLLRYGYTITKIANELGRSVGSVNKQVYLLRVGYGRGKRRSIQRAVFILNQIWCGKSLRAIGRLLGIGVNAILKSIKWMQNDGLVIKDGRRYKVATNWVYLIASRNQVRSR